MTALSYLGCWALRYASWGYHVFPCAPGEKTPHLVVPGKPWTIKWGEVATTDPKQIEAWWAYSPNANIGIAVKPSGLFVVDIDEGPGKQGIKNFDKLCQRYRLDALEAWDTYTVRTPKGGYHLYYRWPAGVKASQASIAKDVDVRSNGGNKGGYVLAPPSVTADGTYRMDNPSAVAPVPSQLILLCTEWVRPEPPRRKDIPAGPANFTGLVDAVRTAPDGNRNNCLLWAARAACDDGATQDEAEEFLIPAATAAGLSEREARQTIRSAYRLQGGSK